MVLREWGSGMNGRWPKMNRVAWNFATPNQIGIVIGESLLVTQSYLCTPNQIPRCNCDDRKVHTTIIGFHLPHCQHQHCQTVTCSIIWRINNRSLLFSLCLLSFVAIVHTLTPFQVGAKSKGCNQRKKLRKQNGN